MKTLGSKKDTGRTLCILAVMFGLAGQRLSAQDVWTSKTDMPTARYLLAACEVEGRIYAIGGALSHHVGTSAVEVYDPASDTWTRKADMPVAATGLGAAVVEGKIYAIGGLTSLWSTYEYDPATDVWTRKADMPTGRGLLSASAVDGKVYAIGGALDTPGPAFRTVEQYDPATDTWTRKADLPEPKYFHAAAVVEGTIYVIAGSESHYTESATVYAYDPAADTWARKADAPTARAWLSAGVLHGRVYAVGGVFSVNGTMYLAGADSGPQRASVEEYDPATDTWTTRTDLPTARGGLAAAAWGDKVYAVGGMRTFWDSFATVEQYDPYPLVVDFNGDGVVDTQDLLQLIESWGQSDPAVDIAPRPCGDGVIDEKDLEILMSHWGEEPGLIARWKLDETSGSTAADSAGTKDGTVIGETLWQAQNGIEGGALLFDGVDDCVTTPFVLDPAAGPFSVFAWIKNGRPGQVILSQIDGVNWLMLAPSGTLATDLRQAGRQGKSLISAAIITDNAWHDVGFVWDGSNRILYLDGVEVARDEQASLAGSTGGLYLGVDNALAAGTFWSGLIDDVRIYDRVVKP